MAFINERLKNQMTEKRVCWISGHARILAFSTLPGKPRRAFEFPRYCGPESRAPHPGEMGFAKECSPHAGLRNSEIRNRNPKLSVTFSPSSPMDGDPSKRKNIDGFTPEQRFFLSLTQLWRTN